MVAKKLNPSTEDGPIFPDDMFERIYFKSLNYDTPEFGWNS